MTARRSSNAYDAWKHELRETPECVRVDRFGETLTPQEQDHIAHCARCEAEFALWEEFQHATPSADEGAAVQWIAAEVARRRAGNPAPVRQPSPWVRWLGGLRPQTLAAAATFLVATLTLAYVMQDREPSVVVPPADQTVYRSARIEVIAPVGDLPEPPSGLSWVAVPAADRYDVAILEVDRTILWRASTREPRIELAPTVIAQFVPGKAILWEVTARRGDAVLAQSGTQRFRVTVKPPQGE